MILALSKEVRFFVLGKCTGLEVQVLVFLGNPRQMFTDSAFYSPKFHPSVAEQVEMAHKLSSSLFEDNNKNSKGHDMFLKRAKKSGKWVTTNQVNNGMLSSLCFCYLAGQL